MKIRLGTKALGCTVAGAIIALFAPSLCGQSGSYDDLLTQAKSALTAKSYQDAVTTSQRAISMDDRRWEAYAVAANAYSGQKLFDDAIGMLQMALPRAPEERKQLVRDALQELRRQMAAASPLQPAQEQARSAYPAPPAVTQPEIVLWKSIENSVRVDDFRAYLRSYPNGAYVALAKARIEESEKTEREMLARAETIKFTPAVAHFSRGFLAHWCYGHLSITSDGAHYDGSQHNVTFSKRDVTEININTGWVTVEFHLNDGHKWGFYKVAEAAVTRGDEKKGDDPGDADIVALVVAKWGWTMSSDHKRLIPSGN